MSENTKKLKKFPYWVRGHILKEETLDANDKILKIFSLDDKKKKVLFELLRNTITKDIFLEQFYQKLKSANLVNPNQTANLAIKVAKARFQPIEKWLGVNVADYIQNWQKNKFDYREEPKVYLEKIEEDVESEETKETQPQTQNTQDSSSFISKISAKAVTDLGQITTEIIKISGLKFSDAVLAKRFENLVMSFLKEIRTPMQVQDFLERPVKVGGLALEKDQTQKIIKLLKTEKKKLEESRRIKGEKPPSEIEKLIASEVTPISFTKKPPTTPPVPRSEAKTPRPVPRSFSEGGSPEPREGRRGANLQPPAKLPVAPEEPHLSEPKPIEPAQPQPQPQPKPVFEPAFGPQKIQEIKPPANKPIKPLPNKNNKPINTINTAPPKFNPQAAKPLTVKRLESINQPPRVTGEVEEIGAIRLVDFRQWSSEPEEAAARVQEKINAIDALDKKARAISAWQNSEINRLYLDIGRASMETGEPIEIVIKKHQAQNKLTLSLAEFNAIADLNRELNF